MGKVGSYTAERHPIPLRVVLASVVALVLALLATTLASASHVEPVAGPANPQTSDCPTGSVGWKYEPVSGGEDLGNGQLVVDVTVTATDLGNTFSFTSNLPLVKVFVKGGADQNEGGSNAYAYDPAVKTDSGLHSPVNPRNGKYFGLSHIVFCYEVETKIIVRKITHPAGDPQSFSFTSNFAGNFSLAHGQQKESGDLQPGTYSVSEAPLEGWDLIASSCDDGSRADAISLSAGETVTCTFRNKKRGRIIVQKEANPSDSGESFPFTASWGSFSLTHGQQADSGLLQEGTYSVSESVPAGWVLSSATCDDGSAPSSIGLNPGETVTCTFVNTRPGTVIVRKIMHGGTSSFDFIGTPSGTISENNGTLTASVAPGQYVTTEQARDGWTLISVACDDDDSEPNLRGRSATFNVDAGETVTCTFRNKKDATLIVEKVMQGGQSTFEFTGTPSGSIATSGGTLSASVFEGTYTSTEAQKAGWELVSIECDDSNSTGDVSTRTATFVAAPGETVRCVFTNRLIPPDTGSITVRKVTNPAGDEQEFDFQFGATSFSLADGGSRTFDDLDAGSYAVSESATEGWDLTSATCDNGDSPDSIDLAEGESVICTFVNTKRGSIVVEKRTNPAGASGFSFTGDAAGTIGDGQQIVVSNLVPGTYTSTESAAAGWLLTSIECSNAGSSGDLGTRTATFDVGAGETVTCVFTNVQQTTGKGSIDVQKSANPTSVKEPGGPVTYSVRITNTSNVDISVTNVVDDKFGDLDDSGGNGCFDVPINLGPGQFASCQFVGQVTGAAGTEHVNVVCADAVDEFGNPLKDCDDARVTITPKVIDLVIVKTATSPTPLNGTVNYSLTVTNKGPDTATNVAVADPAPAGVQYQTATPSQGSCAVGPALVTCQLGTLTAGQTVTIAITARAIAVGTHVNTATVTGDGGREANPADNTDSAQTVVPAPLKPPVKPNKPKPVDVCVSLTVTPKMIKADGKKDRVVAKVRASKKPMKGVRVVVRGNGVRKSGITNGKGVAVIVINPTKPGVITITTVGKGDPCGARRIGVVGVFLPPLTG